MSRPTPSPERIEATISELVDQRDEGKTICPSDAARALAGESDFRPLMEPVREQARRMVDRGELEITQKGEVVDDPSTVRGPIRLRRPPKG